VSLSVLAVCLFSSDDDIDVILRGTVDQQHRLMHQTVKEKSSSEDEFEKEMQSELDDKMKTIEQRWTTGLSACVCAL